MKRIASTLAALLLAHTGALHAATITWSGLGSTDTWAEGANWVGGLPPNVGDRVVFPSGAPRESSVNNIPGALDGVEVRSARTFSGDFTLTGASPIVFDNGSATFLGRIQLNHPAASITGVSGSADIALTLAPSSQLVLASASSLRLDSSLHGRIDVQGPISAGSATLVLSGQEIRLGAANTIGSVDTTAQSVIVSNASALGAASPGTVVNGGTLVFGSSTTAPFDVVESLDLRRADGGVSLRTAGNGSAPMRVLGPITLTGTQLVEAKTFTQIFGRMSGSGKLQVTQAADGVVEIDNNANSFTGGLDILGGKVRPLGNEVIPDANVLLIGSAGTFSMLATTETVRSLDCRGRIEFAPGALLRVRERSSLAQCDIAYLLTNVPKPTEDFTLIRNDSGVAFDGEARNAPEGTALMVGGVLMSFTYRGGASGHDVVLKMPPPPPPPPPPPTFTREVQAASPDGNYFKLSATSLSPTCNFTQIQVVDVRSALIPPDRAPPANLVFPDGLVNFRMEGCDVGQVVTFALEFTEPLPATATYWKFGPTPDNGVPRWYPFPSRVEGNRIVFTITEGGRGDDDLRADGVLHDAGGIAIANGLRQDLWWSGPQENGWGMSIIQHRDILFANFFVYDAQGRPVWYVMPSGTRNGSDTRYTGALYLPHGAPFFAYDVAQHGVGPQIGTATITFGDANNAALDYTINGVSGHKTITRTLYGPVDGVAREHVSDLWWGGVAQNGWGIAVLQQNSTLFSLWFTYDANGAPTWYVMPGGEWIGTDNYRGKIYRAVGPPWLGVPYDLSRHQTIEVGSFSIRFAGGSASFDYSVEGRSGTLSLSRVPF